MTQRVILTDKLIGSDKLVPKKEGSRVEIRDTVTPGLRLRVSWSGHRSFVLCARYPGSPHPTRRRLGRYPILSLSMAREKALHWLRQIADGVDPHVAIREERAAAAIAKVRDETGLFDKVLAAFIANPSFDKQARPVVVARLQRKEFLTRWTGRNIDEISKADCVTAIEEIAKRSEASAHVAFSHLRRLLNWSISTGRLTTLSPMHGIKVADLAGDKVVRDRVLSDDELRAIWQACDQIGYPFGPMIRCLFYTGGRLREVNDLSWGEINMADRLITIPAAHMKGKAAFEIPFGQDVYKLLDGLPQYAGGGCVFSMDGKRPFRGFHKSKVKLEELSDVTKWRLHDARHTARSRWSTIAQVPDMVKELALAHAQPGLHRVYDQHKYRDEKRDLLARWEGMLAGIVDPPEAERLAAD